ncbi:hypothetical protein DPMN_066166 [Dreissena polymorpha]|uniref:Uncharacterized protein n=1 Tax=Dreissena polymorpha TaxID=45954 RepID=A0A9D3YUX9_DREPO|nr:hypothetical protein DPMN_066166 [Dreissena polymorpha]
MATVRQYDGDNAIERWRHCDDTTATVRYDYRIVAPHQQERIVLACERWLELNLIPVLSNNIQLCEMPMDLLQKILKSNRLLTYNEFSVYLLALHAAKSPPPTDAFR